MTACIASPKSHLSKLREKIYFLGMNQGVKSENLIKIVFLNRFVIFLDFISPVFWDFVYLTKKKENNARLMLVNSSHDYRVDAF